MFSQRLRRYAAAILVLSALLGSVAHGATIKFDQSQTGDYNLQIHLKNIELYAVFDDSGGSDDDYGDLPDYTDPTESSSKPPAAVPPLSTATYPTKGPLSSTTEATVAISSTSPSLALLDPYSPSNSDKIVQMVEALIASNGNAADQSTEPPAAAAVPQSSTPLQPPPSQSQSSSSSSAVAGASTASNTTNNRNKCGPGYFRDPMGRCRRIRKPHLPFLQMVHTPGVIKSFQPQQRTTDEVGATSNNNNNN